MIGTANWRRTHSLGAHRHTRTGAGARVNEANLVIITTMQHFAFESVFLRAAGVAAVMTHIFIYKTERELMAMHSAQERCNGERKTMIYGPVCGHLQ